MPAFLRKFLGCFMPNRQRRHAFVENWKDNEIIVVDEKGKEKHYSACSKIKGINFQFDGSGNVLRLHKPFSFNNVRIVLQGGSFVEIGANAAMLDSCLWLCNKGRVKIGKNFHCQEHLQIVGFDEQALEVTIGDDCLFSYDICIRPSDGHPIFDKQTGQMINPGKSIHIGNKVWVGMRSVFLKGACVADNCVVGANSLVTKPLTQSQSIYFGSPAQKRNKSPITWNKDMPN